MRRLALLVTGTALVVWGVAGALGGCGNDDSPIAPGADSGGTSSSSGATSGGTSGATGGTSGTSGTGGPLDAGDGGTSSGAVSNPGKLTCGTTECDAGGGSLCCVREAGANQVCGRQVDCLGGDAFELRCDEKADCANANAKCCFASGGTVCDNDCPGPQNGVQVCKTNEECGDAGPCNQKTCGNGGRVLRVCGSPQNCL